MRPSSGTSLDLSHSAVQPKAKFTKLFESSSIPIKERAFGKKRNLKVPIAKLNPQIQSKAPNFSQLETQKTEPKDPIQAKNTDQNKTLMTRFRNNKTLRKGLVGCALMRG